MVIKNFLVDFIKNFKVNDKVLKNIDNTKNMILNNIKEKEITEDDIKIICSKCNNIFSKENILKWLYAENINPNRRCPIRCNNSEFYEL